MVETHSSEVIREVQTATKIQTLSGIPRNIAAQIVPVIEVNPKLTKDLLASAGTKSTTGNLTILTTPTNQDLKLYGASCCIAKDAACDIATGSINLQATINGLVTTLLAMPVLTLNADNDYYNFILPKAIKIDRNTTIIVSGTFAAGTLFRQATLFYQIDECSNA